jgi:hypothetical protein
LEQVSQQAVPGLSKIIRPENMSTVQKRSIVENVSFLLKKTSSRASHEPIDGAAPSNGYLPSAISAPAAGGGIGCELERFFS